LLSTPLSPCRRYHPAGGVQRVSQIALNPVVFASSPQARPPGLLIPRLHHVCFRYSLVTRDHPFDGLVGRLQNFGFPPPCYPSYGTPTFVPVGLTPTGCASLCWTHGPAQRSLTLWPASSPVAQGDSLHRRLQPLRYLRDCSDCYRLERQLPGGSDPRWKTVPWHGAPIQALNSARQIS
jgi:hypothetical protein